MSHAGNEVDVELADHVPANLGGEVAAAGTVPDGVDFGGDAEALVGGLRSSQWRVTTLLMPVMRAAVAISKWASRWSVVNFEVYLSVGWGRAP